MKTFRAVQDQVGQGVGWTVESFDDGKTDTVCHYGSQAEAEAEAQRRNAQEAEREGYRWQ